MRVLVPLAEGFEEMEAATIIDVLRRADIDVVTVGLVSTVVEGAHKIRFIANNRLSEISAETFDAIVLPGGDPGYKNLMNSTRVIETLKYFEKKKKFIGAICAAPVVLAKAGIIDDKKTAVYPTMESYVPKPRKGAVIMDRNVITSPGPGTALVFALKLVEILSGKERAERIRSQMVTEKEVA